MLTHMNTQNERRIVNAQTFATPTRPENLDKNSVSKGQPVTHSQTYHLDVEIFDLLHQSLDHRRVRITLAEELVDIDFPRSVPLQHADHTIVMIDIGMGDKNRSRVR